MDSTSTRRDGAAIVLVRLLSRAIPFLSRRLPSIGCVLALGSLAPAPLSAQLVLISEARNVFVSYYGGGVETHSSSGTFGLFDAHATGVPFGGGSDFVSQKSDITPDKITVQHSVIDGYGPGGVAHSNFQVTFSLLEATRLTISGYSNFFSGDASLVSNNLGTIPLIWGPNDYFRNFLNFDEVLNPGVYTFTSDEWLRGDNVQTKLELRAQVVSVPESGSSACLFAAGVLSLAAIRRTYQLISVR